MCLKFASQILFVSFANNNVAAMVWQLGPTEIRGVKSAIKLTNLSYYSSSYGGRV